mmetsp:Transcript_17008/g.40340  ORF Transcript_17008/g.40340 Transcript_17008/m.40340 type:complete len:365 (+) Transcript_17008:2356-3450(+)
MVRCTEKMGKIDPAFRQLTTSSTVTTDIPTVLNHSSNVSFGAVVRYGILQLFGIIVVQKTQWRPTTLIGHGGTGGSRLKQKSNHRRSVRVAKARQGEMQGGAQPPIKWGIVQPWHCFLRIRSTFASPTGTDAHGNTSGACRCRHSWRWLLAPSLLLRCLVVGVSFQEDPNHLGRGTAVRGKVEGRQAIDRSSLGASSTAAAPTAIRMTAAAVRRTGVGSGAIATPYQRYDDLHGRLSPAGQMQRGVPPLVVIGDLGGMRLDPRKELGPVPDQRVLVKKRGRSAHNGGVLPGHPNAEIFTIATSTSGGGRAGGVDGSASTMTILLAADVGPSVIGSSICEHRRGRRRHAGYRGPPKDAQVPTHSS